MEVAPYNEIELLDRLSKGDADAFTMIYNRYWKLLFSVATNQLNQPAEAEELVQDLFFDLWNRRTELQINSSLSSYLSVAVNYKVLNVLAKRHRRASYQKSQSHANPEGIDNTTENWLLFEEVKERLHKLVADLPEKCRLVFNLSRQEGLTRKQIASELSISEKTVESHLTKAIKYLRAGLGILFAILFR